MEECEVCHDFGCDMMSHFPEVPKYSNNQVKSKKSITRWNKSIKELYFLRNMCNEIFQNRQKISLSAVLVEALEKHMSAQVKDAYLPRNSINKKISLITHDISLLEVDAIVNPANELPIHPYSTTTNARVNFHAGNSLKVEFESKVEQIHRGHVTPPLGQVVLTHGHQLPCKYILHTIDHIPDEADDGDFPILKKIIERSYQRCLEIAEERDDISSIAFSCISSEFSQISCFAEAHIALKAVREYLEKAELLGGHLDLIVFVVDNPKDQEIYETLLQYYFPIDLPSYRPDDTHYDVENEICDSEDVME